jgi:hypothetical protein
MYALRIEPRYKVSRTNLYRCGMSFISQPLNYFLIFLIFQGSMIIYFISTVKLSHSSLVTATAVIYAITTLIHLAFPCVDPGIIPSILHEYE